MLADIGGGINPSVRLGEVVISTRVIGYDIRKEIPGRVIPRGQEWQAPAEIGHAVSTFFAGLEYPAEVSGMLGKGTGQVRAIHDQAAGEQPSSWLVIRGISDHANEAKDDRYRYIAAFNAAAALQAVLPYLPVRPN